MAGARGWKLRRLRYPKDHEALTAAALDRDRFSTDQWVSWQADRLSKILDRAARLVPHYREHGAAAGIDATEVTDAAALCDWPLLSKDAIQRDPRRFVADDRTGMRLHRVNTSGTSGTPLTIFRHRDDEARHYAIYEARVRRWNDVSRHDKWAMMGGQLVVPFERDTPPFWVWSQPLNQLYLSTNHLKPANAGAYASQLTATAPTHLVGYSSSMTLLAQMALDQGLALPELTVAISNAEPLLDTQRETLRLAFGCEVRDTYGMSEGAASAAECARGSLHVSPDNGLVEIIGEDGMPAAVGTAGEIVVTGFTNESMILIRYRTGDRGVLSPSPCSCGLGAPVIERIEGRTSDLIRTPDGRQVFWLNPVFAGLPVRESQVVQHAVDDLEVRVVTAPEWNSEHVATLTDRLKARVGAMSIRVNPVSAIERGPGGKFRPVVSLVDK